MLQQKELLAQRVNNIKLKYHYIFFRIVETRHALSLQNFVSSEHPTKIQKQQALLITLHFVDALIT